MEKLFFTPADVAMIGHGSGVYQYSKLYNQHLENDYLLPRPYLRIFECNDGGKNDRKKWMLDLAGEDQKSVWECIEKMTENKYWQTLDTFLRTAI